LCPTATGNTSNSISTVLYTGGYIGWFRREMMAQYWVVVF